jgi:hypothetical protein
MARTRVWPREIDGSEAGATADAGRADLATNLLSGLPGIGLAVSARSPWRTRTGGRLS